MTHATPTVSHDERWADTRSTKEIWPIHTNIAFNNIPKQLSTTPRTSSKMFQFSNNLIVRISTNGFKMIVTFVV